jgi:hypothetical protein
VVAAAPGTGPKAVEKARLVAHLAGRLGIDLRLVAAIKRGDISPEPKPPATPSTDGATLVR